MSDGFNSFPVLTDNLRRDAGFSVNGLSLYYMESGRKIPLDLDGITPGNPAGRGSIKDTNNIWSPETHELRFKLSCSMTAAYCLLGKNGLAPTSATLGLALQWISTKSDERGVIPFGSIGSMDSAEEYTVEGAFEKGRLKGSLLLTVILYLKTPGKNGDGDIYSTQIAGTIFGRFQSIEIFIDGSGSVFPIVEIDKPGEALWRVYYSNTCDPMQDRFDNDNIEIQINRAHEYYPLLKIGEPIAESPLLTEVLTSALLVIVESVKDSSPEDWSNIINGEGFEAGTIAEAVYYFITKLQWDVESPSNLVSSIKNFFEKNT